MTSPTITALARTTLLTATLGLLSLSQAHAQSLIIEPGTTTVEPAASFSLTVSGKDFDTAIVGGGFKSLKEGEKVSYEVTQGPKGKQATNIQKP